MTFNLMVRKNGDVSGHVQITQAVAPAGNYIYVLVISTVGCSASASTRFL
jgi:hypothetical protein